MGVESGVSRDYKRSMNLEMKLRRKRRYGSRWVKVQIKGFLQSGYSAESVLTLITCARRVRARARLKARALAVSACGEWEFVEAGWPPEDFFAPRLGFPVQIWEE